MVHEQSAVKNSYSTYVCYAPDGLFWLNLYVIPLLLPLFPMIYGMHMIQGGLLVENEYFEDDFICPYYSKFCNLVWEKMA